MSYSRDDQSKDCYKRLQDAGLIDHYPKFETKEIGQMVGVTLFGKSKSSIWKTIFVKEYQFHSNNADGVDYLNDYAAFTLLKKCGGRAPKVKLKASRNHVYIFSTDVSQQQAKHAERKYDYQDSGNGAASIDLLEKKINMDINLFGLGRAFPLDKISVARTLLLGVILRLSDLHDQNFGFVISSEGNAKLAFIDFSCAGKKIEIDRDHSVYGFVRSHYSGISSVREFSDLITLMSDSDYIVAFKKIEETFDLVCGEVAKKAEVMSFVSPQKKSNFKNVLAIWRDNFLAMQEFVHAAEHGASSVRKKKL